MTNKPRITLLSVAAYALALLVIQETACSKVDDATCATALHKAQTEFQSWLDQLPAPPAASRSLQAGQSQTLSVDIRGWKEIWLTIEADSPGLLGRGRWSKPTLVKADGTHKPLARCELISKRRDGWAETTYMPIGDSGFGTRISRELGFRLDDSYERFEVSVQGTRSQVLFRVACASLWERAFETWDALSDQYPRPMQWIKLDSKGPFFRQWLHEKGSRIERTLIQTILAKLSRIDPSLADEYAERVRTLDEGSAAASAGQWWTLYFDVRKDYRQRCLPSALGALSAKSRELVLVQRQRIDCSHVYTYFSEGHRPGGGLYVCILDDQGRVSQWEELVSTPRGLILDYDISFDGRRILFSWRKDLKDDSLHLYCINTDGSGLRQLTEGPWCDYNARWLPDGGIVFLSTRNLRIAYCWQTPSGVLYRMDSDGKNVQRISGNYLSDFTPSVLPTGRIVYGRWEYVDKPAIPIQSLWTLNPDGTQLRGYYGNRVLQPGCFLEPRAIPGSPKILCALTTHAGRGASIRGAVGRVDRSRGVNSQAAIENLTPEIDIGKVNEGSGQGVPWGPYENPYPVDDSFFLVSRLLDGEGAVLLRDYEGLREVILAGPRGGLGCYNAQPLHARERPSRIASTSIQTTDNWATVFVQDVYDGLEPHIQRGEIKQIAVIEEVRKSARIPVNRLAFGFQFPVTSYAATYAPKKVWGYADVEEDGSAHFRVPARLPIYFMTLDAQGRARQRMRSLTHLMPGEVQGCVGCHESREHTGRLGRLPDVSMPVGQAGGLGYGSMQPKALAREAQPLRVPEWGQDGFSYSRIVQPVLDRYCVACHHPLDKAGGLDLTGDYTDYFNVSYETLVRRRGEDGGEIARDLRKRANFKHVSPDVVVQQESVRTDSDDNPFPYVSWIPTLNGFEQNILQIAPNQWGSPQSRLADLVLSGHPDEQGKPRIQLDEESMRRMLAWIDLNIPYYGTGETAYPENKGCRKIYPERLDAVLKDVVGRRCTTCHTGGSLPHYAVRVTNPQHNAFLLAPLAKSAGGTEACGQAVFRSTNDTDFQAILETFQPIEQLLAVKPRMDMPGGQPDPCTNRCLK